MISLLQISNMINGDIIGNQNLEIEGVCDIEFGKKNYLTYIKNYKFQKYIKDSKASALIVDRRINITAYNDKSFIVVENPSMAIIEVLNFFKRENIPSKIGVSKYANISDKAKIGANVFIGPNVTIDDNVHISDNVRIDAGSYIGYNSSINENTHICSNVTIYENVLIGKNCRIDSSTVIGSEGFGVVSDMKNKKNYNIPHVGSVKIGNNVTIGSNCSIDRGTINDTIINDYTKLDNLIQIGHNVKIGKSCLIAAQVGIAGSTTIDDCVTIAGQVGIVDHVNIGKNSVIAVKSCVFKSLPKNSYVSGIPATNHSNRLKQEAIIKKLPDIYKKYKNK